MKKYSKAFGILLLIAGTLVLAWILFQTTGAVKNLSSGYRELKDADLTEDFSGTVYYDDGLYAVIGSGVNIDETVTDRQGMMASFLRTALLSIDRRVCSAGIIYAMLVSTIIAYPLYLKSSKKRRRYILSACLSVAVLFFIYIAAVLILHQLYGVPFFLPATGELLRIGTGLICVMGGCSALMLLISVIRFKKTVAVIVVPLVIILFMLGFMFEYQLYSPPHLDSFEYISQIDERVLDEDFVGDFYYDEDKNVVILEGKEYPPEQVENEDYVTGTGRLGRFLYEILNPYSGNSLNLIEQELRTSIGLPVYGLYTLKAALWIILAAFAVKRKRQKETV